MDCQFIMMFAAKPATYERILKNIEGCKVNVHLTVTQPMMERDDYLDEIFFILECAVRDPLHLAKHIHTASRRTGSGDTQTGSEETTDREDSDVAQALPKLLMFPQSGEAFSRPPASPEQCTFATMSANYSADLKTRVEPCIFGGVPDCSQCGCAVSIAMHCLQDYRLKGPLKAGHFVRGSMRVGRRVNRLRPNMAKPVRWKHADGAVKHLDLVRIQSAECRNLKKMPRSLEGGVPSPKSPHVTMTARGSACGPVIVPVFKTGGRHPRDVAGVFDSHTLPPI